MINKLYKTLITDGGKVFQEKRCKNYKIMVTDRGEGFVWKVCLKEAHLKFHKGLITDRDPAWCLEIVILSMT